MTTYEKTQDLQRPPTQTYGSAFLTKARILIVRHEGSVQFGYRDSTPQGHFTCGTGHLVATAGDCQKLPWLSRLPGPGYDLGVRADAESVNDMYTAVMSMKPGLVASAYASASPLRLSLQTVSDLLDTSIDTCIVGLCRILPNFDTMPESARLACIDIAYQAGPHGFQAHFPKLVAALIAGDFYTAAVESHRAASSQARNDEIKALFLAAKGA